MRDRGHSEPYRRPPTTPCEGLASVAALALTALALISPTDARSASVDWSPPSAATAWLARLAGGTPEAGGFPITSPGRAAALLSDALRRLDGSAAVAAAASGTSYYVDAASGNDANAGTSPATAWRTLARASKVTLGPGDSIVLARGRTYTGGLAVTANGTAESPVAVGDYGAGALPVISGGTAQKNCVQVEGQYVLVYELVSVDCGWAGFYIGGDHVAVAGSGAAYNSVGVHVGGSADGALVYGNVLAANNSYALNPDARYQVALNGTNADVRGNVLVGPGSSAIEIYGYSALNGGNAVFGNISVDNEDFSELGQTTNNSFSYNLVVSSVQNAHGLNIQGPGTGDGPVYGTTYNNNTVYLTGVASEGFVCNGTCDGTVLTLRNNIIHAVWKAGYGFADDDYDLYDCPGCVFDQILRGPHSLRADAQFLDFASRKFDLRPGSPAIDAGAFLGYSGDLRGSPVPLGARPDLGALEARP